MWPIQNGMEAPWLGKPPHRPTTGVEVKLMSKRFRVFENSLQDRFLQSRAKIQVYGGGFANGKTATACIKMINIAKDYPGANLLIARATYPKLMDTVAKEFFKWLPQHWIKSYTKTPNPTLVLTNGTVVNFRHVAQQGGTGGMGEASTSNLLSATYDAVLIDQIEDPDITEKDFYDILGRLRGMARYEGEDATMPKTGPRWFLVNCNPTGNWFYKKIVKPLHDYQRGIKNDDLLVDSCTGKPIVELFEGSTYENRDNLEEDFIRTLEASYKGQMRDRFLLGKWASYEGLVYPQYDPDIHQLRDDDVQAYYEQLHRDRRVPTIFEGYDYGLAVPSCYLVGFTDHVGNMFIVDGFYETGLNIEEQAKRISEIRVKWDLMEGGEKPIFADPAVFRRTTGDKKTVGKSVSDLFEECGVRMQRGNNDIMAGITKIQGFLSPQDMHRHPLTGTYGAPFLYFCGSLNFLDDEFLAYYWKRDSDGEHEDRPQDKRDHAMDTLKYMLTEKPPIAHLIKRVDKTPAFMRWQEYDTQQRDARSHRYG